MSRTAFCALAFGLADELKFGDVIFMQTIVLKNARLWVETPPLKRIIITLLSFLCSLVLRWGLSDILEAEVPVQFFLLDALLVSALYGYIPALICLLGGWMLCVYFFVVPYAEISSINKSDVFLALSYFLIGLFGIAVVEYLQRVRCSTRLMLAVSESRYRSLLRLDNHRLHQQRQTVRSLRQVSDIFSHLDQALLFTHQDGKFFSLPLLTKITGHTSNENELGWLYIVHADHRPRVERELASLMAGQRESCELHFKLSEPSVAGNQFTALDCVFRVLTLSPQKQIYALFLKALPLD